MAPYTTKVEATQPNDIVPLDQLAARFNLSPRTPRDSRWRRRWQIRVVKIGGRVLGVREADIQRALRRERFAPQRNNDGGEAA